jgi:long-chain acyl-CoA synthetase
VAEPRQKTSTDALPDTLISLFRDAVSREKPNLLNYKQDGQWRAISSKELAAKVRTIAMGLYALKVKPGDHLGILSENRVEWTMADLAILNYGAADVPIYATQAPKQVAYILNDAAVEILFISDQAQYDRVRDALNTCPKLRVIISFDAIDAPKGRVMSLADFLVWGKAADESDPKVYETLGAHVTPDSLATLIYTSGTTGDPKGVMLTHGNLVSNCLANYKLSKLTGEEATLTYLPFSHILERTAINMYLHAGVSIYYARGIDTVAEDLQTARPHFMTSVPRLFEKIYARALEKAEESGKLTVRLVRWALDVGRQWAIETTSGKEPSRGLQFRRKIADKLVFSKWRSALGGRVQTLVSGGAPLSRDLALTFYGAGLRIFEGYGLTESSPTIAVNHEDGFKIGSVGKPMPGIDVKIAEDGEILASGPNIMRGYYAREEATAETLKTDAQGRVWLHTGDIGHLDEEGYLFITDRKKDLLKTSGGKYIAPQPIENAIKRSRYISQVVVIGDQRKFPSALIVPRMDQLKTYAEANGVSTADPAELVKDPKIIGLIEREVGAQTKELSHFEQIKAVLLLDRELTIESGELTPTLKVKRRVVVEKNKRQIDRLYAEKEAAHAS